jgi:hypothetical protein
MWVCYRWYAEGQYRADAKPTSFGYLGDLCGINRMYDRETGAVNMPTMNQNLLSALLRCAIL